MRTTEVQSVPKIKSNLSNLPYPRLSLLLPLLFQTFSSQGRSFFSPLQRTIFETSVLNFSRIIFETGCTGGRHRKTVADISNSSLDRIGSRSSWNSVDRRATATPRRQLITAKGRKEAGSRPRLNFHASLPAMCLSHRAWRSRIISGPEARLCLPARPLPAPKDVTRNGWLAVQFLEACVESSFIYLAGQEAVHSSGSPAVTN